MPPQILEMSNHGRYGESESDTGERIQAAPSIPPTSPSEMNEIIEENDISQLIRKMPFSQTPPKYKEVIIGQEYTNIVTTSNSYFDLDGEDDKPIRRREGIIKTSNVLKKLFDIATPNTTRMELHPANCRFKAEHKNKAIYILEDPPTIRSVQFSLPF